MVQMSEREKSSGFVSAALAVVFFGVVGTSVVGYLLSQQGGTIGFSLERIFSYLSYTGDVISFGVIIIGWFIGGLVGGIRMKNPEGGLVAGFFGAFLGGFFAFILGSADEVNVFLQDFNPEPFATLLPPYLVGVTGIILASAIAGYAGGKTTMQKGAMTRKAPQSKIKGWDKSKSWKCRKCGAELTPGVDRCPTCGAPAY